MSPLNDFWKVIDAQLSELKKATSAAERLGISNLRPYRARHIDTFPEPLNPDSGSPVWDMDAIAQWYATTVKPRPTARYPRGGSV